MQQQQDTKLSLLHEKIQTCLFSLWLLKVSYHVLCLLNVAKTRTTYIDVSSVVQMLDPELCRSLQGLHAFNGCDSVSAFSGKIKVLALKMARQSESFQTLFQEIGTEWNITLS